MVAYVDGEFFMLRASLDEAVDWATVADIVRREKSRVVATLVRQLGSIDAAEDAFQEAVLAALPSWRSMW